MSQLKEGDKIKFKSVEDKKRFAVSFGSRLNEAIAEKIDMYPYVTIKRIGLDRYIESFEEFGPKDIDEGLANILTDMELKFFEVVEDAVSTDKIKDLESVMYHSDRKYTPETFLTVRTDKEITVTSPDLQSVDEVIYLQIWGPKVINEMQGHIQLGGVLLSAESALQLATDLGAMAAKLLNKEGTGNE